MKRYLITKVRQSDGSYRELYARTSGAARVAREMVRDNPANFDGIRVAEWVDVEPDGTRRRYVLDGAS